MRRLSRLPILAVAIAALALSAAIAPATSMASGFDVYVCTFNGSVSGNPPFNSRPGNGTFSLSTNAATWCEGVRQNTDGRNASETGPARISANGTYSNLGCGTGQWQGTATLSADFTTVPSGVTFPFNVLFAGGEGVIAIVGASNSEGAGGAGWGYAGLAPVDLAPCVLADVSTFGVSGAFAITIPVA